MDFGQRLKLLREEKDMDREQLGERLGMSYSTIAKYETNNRFPDRQTLLRLADIFDVSLDYLLGKSEFRKTLPQSVEPYLPEGFEELPPEAREEVLVVLDYIMAKYGRKGDRNKD